MSRLRRVVHLLAETAREIGTLVLVFGPLEWAFADRAFEFGVLLALVALSVALIACAILVEAGE